MFALALPLLSALGCTPTVALNKLADDTATDGGGTSTGTDGGTTTTPTEPDWSAYDGATLQITSPVSGTFYPLGTDIRFTAELRAADGSSLPAVPVTWTSTADGTWSGSDADFYDQLAVGNHTIYAVAELPNGDRLGWTVSGVLVQHEDAGTYVGDMSVDFVIEYNGSPVTTTCFGSATLYVDAWGEAATGASSCNLSLLGYDLATTYDFDFDVDEGAVEGSAALDLVLWESVFDATGTVGDGNLEMSWASSLLGFLDFEGELDLTRISRETEPAG